MPLPDDVIASARLLADITGRLPATRRTAIPQSPTPKGNPMTGSQALAYFLSRLAEPSTHAALFALAANVAVSSTGTTQVVAGAVAALLGTAAVATPEKK